MRGLCFLLICFQCHAMKVPARDLNVLPSCAGEISAQSPETCANSNVADVESSRRWVYSVSMQIFHDMYQVFCSKNAGGDRFFEEYGEFDPPVPENGMLDLKTRYLMWAKENGVTVPNNGDELVMP